MRPSAVRLAAAVLGIVLAAAGCDQLTFDELDRDHSVTIQNLAACDLRIHLDEAFLFPLLQGETITIDGLEPGFHHLAAYVNETGTDGALASEIELDAGGYEDFVWRITGCGAGAR